MRGETALIWGTYNSREFPEKPENYDYWHLPDEFHAYFEETGQVTDAD